MSILKIPISFATVLRAIEGIIVPPKLFSQDRHAHFFIYTFHLEDS